MSKTKLPYEARNVALRAHQPDVCHVMDIQEAVEREFAGRVCEEGEELTLVVNAEQYEAILLYRPILHEKRDKLAQMEEYVKRHPDALTKANIAKMQTLRDEIESLTDQCQGWVEGPFRLCKGESVGDAIRREVGIFDSFGIEDVSGVD